MGKIVGIDLGTTYSVDRGYGSWRGGCHTECRGRPYHAICCGIHPRRASDWLAKLQTTGGREPGEHDFLDQAFHGTSL